MSKITGSHLIANVLAKEGLKNIFTLAGDHILPVIDVMSDFDFRFFDTRHEQAAVHMADVWARATDNPGIVMTTTPGFANAIPGLASALHAESPMLSISGSAETSELGKGAMQEIDQVGMAAPVTKASWIIDDAAKIPLMMNRALKLAYSGRRGPVHLTIPVDVQEQKIQPDQIPEIESFRGNMNNPQESISSKQIDQLLEILISAERPLIIAGSAASYGDVGRRIQEFVEMSGIPLLTEGDARGIVSDDHPLCFGFFDTALNGASKLISDADVVLLLGRKQDFVIGYTAPPIVSKEAALMQIDPQQSEIGRNRPVEVGICGDVSSVLDIVIDSAKKRIWPTFKPWIKQLTIARRKHFEVLESFAKSENPLHAMAVHNTVKSFLEPDDLLVFDGGDFCHFARAYLPAVNPRSWWYLPPLGMLGSGLPTALALKIAHPERRVILFSGDGSFGFNGFEFDTAVRHNLPIVCVLGNDSAWGIDRQIQLQLYDRSVATDLLPSKYDQLVRSLGGYGEHVEHIEELPDALERALKFNRPSLLNVSVQRAISPRAQAAVDRWKSSWKSEE